MCAPAAPRILEDLGTTKKIDRTLLVSIWELGEAFGPLLIAPLSELYGRAPLYHTTNILFCAFSIGCALSRNMNMLIAFRFLNGFSVASIVLNPSIIGDMFITEQRGSAMSIMGLAPLLGPALGPIVGGYVAQSIGWRWLFGLTAILAAVLECGFLAIFRETYAPRILQQKGARPRTISTKVRQKVVPDSKISTSGFFVMSIVRPARMLVSSPIIFFLSVYVAVVFGYIYILFTSISEVFEEVYGFSTGAASLTFISLGEDQSQPP